MRGFFFLCMTLKRGGGEDSNNCSDELEKKEAVWYMCMGR